MANFDMNASDFDLFEDEDSTSSSILDTVDSPNSLVVFIFKTPVKLMQPLITSSPALTSFGRLSPVNAEVLSVESPSSIIPSMGIFSPGNTVMISDTDTSSGDTFSSFPSISTFA